MTAWLSDLAVGDVALVVERHREPDRALFLRRKRALGIELLEDIPVGRVLRGLCLWSLREHWRSAEQACSNSQTSNEHSHSPQYQNGRRSASVCRALFAL